MNIHKKMELPEEVELVLRKLHIKTHKAYVCGGCVRDYLLGIIPKDYDITTSCKPDDVVDIFVDLGYKVILTGIKHGTVTIMVNDMPIEVTTFRTDGDYDDNRHPNSVEFVSDLKLDVSRRDFTINALAYNHEEGLIDYFNGVGDIENRIIRCVGHPDERFKEDALRMLRAIRFASQLEDFTINSFTFNAITSNAKLINNISKERIRDELNKILLNNSIAIHCLNHSGLWKYILTEFNDCYKCEQNNPNHFLDVARHSILAVSNTQQILHLRLAMLLHDIGKPVTKTTDDNGIDHFQRHPMHSVTIAEKFLKEYRYDNETIKRVLLLIEYHDIELVESKKSIKKILNKLGSIEVFEELLVVRMSDILAQHPSVAKEKIERVNMARQLARIVVDDEEAFSLKHLAVNGQDLLDMGMKEGKFIGEILKNLLDYVIEYPRHNTKEKLISLIVNPQADIEKYENGIDKT